MDPITLALIAKGIQTGVGIYQGIKGANMAKKAVRPEYQIPEEVMQNLNQAEIQALEGLPAEQKAQFLDNIQRSTQASVGALGDRKAGLAGMSSVQQNEIDAYRGLLSQDAAQRQANQGVLMDQRQNVAGYKDKAFEINEMQPFMDQAAAAEAMKGAGLQNIVSSLGSMGQMALDYKFYQDILGKKPTPTPTAINMSQTATPQEGNIRPVREQVVSPVSEPEVLEQMGYNPIMNSQYEWQTQPLNGGIYTTTVPGAIPQRPMINIPPTPEYL